MTVRPHLFRLFSAALLMTLLAVDQEGKVRDIHVGWSADLKQQLIATVDRLLSEQPPADQ